MSDLGEDSSSLTPQSPHNYLRDRLVLVLRDNIDYHGPDDYFGDLAEAVIQELEDGYLLIPKAHTLAQQAHQSDPSHRPRAKGNYIRHGMRYLCEDCGSLVIDTRLHDNWHVVPRVLFGEDDDE
jgi:hypothetical protein